MEETTEYYVTWVRVPRAAGALGRPFIENNLRDCHGNSHYHSCRLSQKVGSAQGAETGRGRGPDACDRRCLLCCSYRTETLESAPWLWSGLQGFSGHPSSLPVCERADYTWCSTPETYKVFIIHISDMDFDIEYIYLCFYIYIYSMI